MPLLKSIPEPDLTAVSWVENDDEDMDTLEIQVQAGPLQRRTKAANPQPGYADDFQVCLYYMLSRVFLILVTG